MFRAGGDSKCSLNPRNSSPDLSVPTWGLQDIWWGDHLLHECCFTSDALGAQNRELLVPSWEVKHSYTVHACWICVQGKCETFPVLRNCFCREKKTVWSQPHSPIQCLRSGWHSFFHLYGCLQNRPPLWFFPLWCLNQEPCFEGTSVTLSIRKKVRSVASWEWSQFDYQGFLGVTEQQQQQSKPGRFQHHPWFYHHLAIRKITSQQCQHYNSNT